MCNRKYISGTRVAKGLFLAIASAILIFSTAGTTYAADSIHGSVQLADNAMVIVGQEQQEHTEKATVAQARGDPDDVDVGSSDNKVKTEKPKNDSGDFFQNLFKGGEKEEPKPIHGGVVLENEGLVVIHDGDDVVDEPAQERETQKETSSFSTRSSTKPVNNDISDFVKIVDNSEEKEPEAETVTETEEDVAEERTEEIEEVVETEPETEVISEGNDIREEEAVENVDHSSEEYLDEVEEPDVIVIKKGHVDGEEDSGESVIIKVRNPDEPRPAESVIKAGLGTVDENEIIYDNYGEIYEDENGDVVYKKHRHDGAEDESIIYDNDNDGNDIINDEPEDTDYEDNDYEEDPGGEEETGGQIGDGYFIPDPPYTTDEPLEAEPEAAQDIREAGGGDENLYEPDEPPESEETPTISYPEYANGEGEDVLLAKLIYHESANQPYAGRVAVAEVVMNRVYSGKFPDNVYDVIYQPHQFSYNSEIAGSPVTEENLGIARRVIAGTERAFYNPEVLYFRNSMTTSGIPQSSPVDWGPHSWYGYVSGHAFYTQN